MERTVKFVQDELILLIKKIEAHQKNPNCDFYGVVYNTQEEAEAGTICMLCNAYEDEYTVLMCEMEGLQKVFNQELLERGLQGLKLALDLVKPIDQSDFYKQFYKEIEWRLEAEKILQAQIK